MRDFSQCCRKTDSQNFREHDFSITQRRITVPGHYNATLVYDVEDYMEVISELMSTTTPSLYALHTVQIRFHHSNYTCKQLLMGPWRTLIEAIFLLPALESLVLEAPWFAENETFPSLTLLHTNLRCFVYRAPFSSSLEAIRTPEYGRRSVGQIAAETHNLRLLLDANRDTLEILELPGELADSLLDSPFPSLKELSLFGYGPDRHTLSRALLPVSHLRKLHIETVFSGPPSPIPVSSHITRAQITKLRSLTLSNPCPNDPLFGMLPPNVEHLSLIPYPEPFMLWWTPESKIPVEIVPCSAITAILNSGSFRSLISLNISYLWESDWTEIFLLDLIPQVSPYLEFLELNR